jgi:acyl-CoA reductase-like NAD-dependent aldehyde dehydrogenase
MADFQTLVAEAQRVTPEAFDSVGRLLPNAGAGRPGAPRWSAAVSPIDGSELAELPNLDTAVASDFVHEAAENWTRWSAKSLKERSALIIEAIQELRKHRDLLSGLLTWELGKTKAAADVDVDRCLSGVEWYLDEIPGLLEGRAPLGVVSNVASWNYPFSVLLYTELVQALAGNTVIAKTPSRGGGIALTVAHAIAQRHGLPLTLLGGRGADLSEALVSHSAIAAVSFVGGRTHGSAVAAQLRHSGRRYALEMEGVNSYAITDFSNWHDLKKQIQAGFDFGKQRCTAYTRWVVERSLVPQFVETYRAAVSAVRVGNPLGTPHVTFGPLIAAAKVEELRARMHVALTGGAQVLYAGALAEETFRLGQQRDAYLAPTLLTDVPSTSDLYTREPFGPVDVLVVVDTEEELVREANVSDGALVASIATDDPERARRLAARLNAFKVGINRLRSRGDREESFGGTGRSWEGAFVGGAHLIDAFTDGGREPLGRYPWRDQAAA